MQIEISIAEAEFLKGLVYNSSSWETGGRMADVVFKLEEALHAEGEFLMVESGRRESGPPGYF